MPRTDLPVRNLKNFDGALSDSECLDTWTAGDPANNNAIPGYTGREVISVKNTGASPRTFSVISVPDPETQRTGDITTHPLAVGEEKTLDLLPMRGWRQSDGKLYINPSHAEVAFKVLRLPVLLPQ